MIRRISNALRCLAVVAALLHVMPIPAMAISESLITARQGFQAAMDNGDFEAALPFAEDTVELAEDEFPRYDPRTAAFQFDLAVLYGQLGKVGKAPKLLKTAIRTLEKTEQPNDGLLRDAYNALGNTYFAIGKPSQAWTAWKNQLAFEEALFGPDSPELAATLRSIAAAAVRAKSIKAGLPYYTRLAEIVASEYGEQHEAYAEILTEIGDMNYVAGNRIAAESQLLEALAIFEDNYPGDPRIMRAHKKIGEMYVSFSEFELSGQYLAKAKAASGEYEATPIFTPYFSYRLSRDELLKPAFARVSFIVDVDGATRNIEVIESNSTRLGRRLASSIAEWQFDPATRDGVAYETEEVTGAVFHSPYTSIDERDFRISIGTRTGSAVYSAGKPQVPDESD